VDLVRVHQPPALLSTQSAIHRGIEKWADADLYLERRSAAFAAETGLIVTQCVPSGDPVEHICARAIDIGADLVIMTSHGRTGFSRFWLGSVTDGVVRQSRIPVLILRAQEDENADAAPVRLQRLLVPLDGSKLAADALGPAAGLAVAEDAEMLLLHIVHPVPMVTEGFENALVGPMPTDQAATRLLVTEGRAYLEREAATLVERGVKRVAGHVMVSAHTAKAIIALTKTREVDAIVMSTHGRGLSRLVIGSVADKVLRASDVPLLLHRPAGAATAAPLIEEGEVELQLKE